MYNKLEKLENRITNVEIQQNTIIIIGKDPKYIKGTTGNLVEHIIFRKYLEKDDKKRRNGKRKSR